MATSADQETPSSLLLPALIVLTAVVMTLEILQRLLLARIAAVALLGVIWSVAFPPELQVRAALGALVYHSGAELLLTRRRQQRRSRFDSDHSDRNDSEGEEEEEGGEVASGGKDWRFIRSLLFLVRVFVWGATLAAATAIPNVRAGGDNSFFFLFVVQWWDTAMHALATMAALTSYCEVLEVLVLLYFADQERPYRWRKRAPLWLLSSIVGVLETSGLLSFVAHRLVDRISTLGLVGVLVAGMYVSVQMPWRRVVALVETVAAAVLRGAKKKTTRLDELFRSQLSDDEEDDEEEGLELADDWRYTDQVAVASTS